MAKIIRCPNCGENVEVPPNPAGQIVTCVACGTAMRLKSKKDVGERPKGDPSAGSLSGSLSGSMTATRITSDAVQSSPDDPPSLGSECEVCGRPTDPSELIEDRGHLTCRDCIKGARSSRSRKPLGEEELIPFSRAPEAPVRRGSLITFGLPFFIGCAALAVYVAADLFLVFNTKPVGTGVIAKTADEPPRSRQTSWDEANLPVLVKMMEEATALKADPKRQGEARKKYQAVVAHAKGNESGSQEVRRLVDLAEQEAQRLAAGAAPAPPEPIAPAPTNPPIEVPDTVASTPNSVFQDNEARIDEKLNAGLTDLEAAAAAASGGAAEAHAAEAMRKFSEARDLLNKERRNFPEDPGWTFANHGTAVAYIYARNYPLALLYLDRLPSPPDRAAIINRVVTLLQMRENKGEAIQLLIDHLKSDAGADDNYALNLLGTTLARYPEEIVKEDKLLTQARETYDELVKKLGAKHPGERRWGTRWIGINEWEAKDKERRIQTNRLEELERALARSRSRIANLKADVDRGRASDRQRALLIAEQGEEQRLLAEIQTTQAKIPLEEWLTPEQIVPVLPDVTAVNARPRSGSTDDARTQPTTRGG
ncbi:MAG TPA: hypothetical protein VGR35_18200 [Tepidisphaeraceae bacterium]|nr:hypothetical protein [Tepidisphaeraceae bacterium]